MSNEVPRGGAATTALILVLATISSVLGLARRGHYNDPVAMLPRIYAQDVVILLVGVPALAIGLWSASRGSLRGSIVWLGSLAFMAYMWASYAFTLAYNRFFLGYVVLFGLSLFTLVGGLAALDPDRVSDTLRERLSPRRYAGLLGLVAIGLAALWLAELVPAAVAGTAPAAVRAFGARAAATYVIDLGVVVPSVALTADRLRRQRPSGYAAMGVVLVFAALVAPAVTAITAIDIRTGVAVSLPVVAGSVLPPIVAGTVAVRYLHALGASGDRPA